MPETTDKAGVDYWNSVWQADALPDPIDPRLPGRQNRVNRALHQFFARQFRHLHLNGPDVALLEVGAARSQWLPYFASEFGFSVTGLDYSPAGCEQARAILQRHGIRGTVVEADLFNPPAELQQRFDVVVSFGVVEHFTATAVCVEAMARFLKPGGTMITEVPNLVGIGGQFQRRICPEIMAVHVPLSARELRRAHQEAGLHVESCGYFLSGGFSSLNVSCRHDGRGYQVISRVPMMLTTPFLAMETVGLSSPPNRLTSPYVICVARREG